MLYVVYATDKGAPQYMESIKLETHNSTKAAATAKELLLQGYENIRIAKHSDIPEKPNFIKTINI